MLRSWLVKRRLHALAVERCHPSDGTSASDNYSPVPQEFAAAVVALVDGLVPVVGFPVLPEDNLWQLYDIDQGSLESESEDFILRMLRARRHSLRLALRIQLRQYETLFHCSIHTPNRFWKHCPTIRSSGAPRMGTMQIEPHRGGSRLAQLVGSSHGATYFRIRY